MNIHFADPAEAFAGIASVVVAADNVGSIEERQFLFEQVQGLELFKDYTQPAFNQLLSKITQQMYDTLEIDQETMGLTPQSIETLFLAVKECLTPQLCESALRMAVSLAHADEASEEEKQLLARMAQCLEIEKGTAQNILG